MKSALISLVFLAGFLGCDEPFNVKADFEERVVVYAVLSNRTTTSIARVYRTYDPPSFDPLAVTTEMPVRNATVTVSEGRNTYQYAETTLTRKDKSRYLTDIEAYHYRPFVVQAGKQYTLSVATQQFGITMATTSVPDTGDLRFEESDPDFLWVLVKLGPQAKGYMVRCYIEFQATVGGQVREFRIEVPSVILYYIDNTRFGAEYPTLVRRTGIGGQFSRSDYSELALFSRQGFEIIREKVAMEYQGVTNQRTVFILTQADEHLYNYYNIVNGFQDPYLVRLDEPDYTNIRGGVGVFGSFFEQTFVYEVQ
ncbi:MAG TPA: DUF4249 family protein [Bacteroidota bacterium]|nr:DUF4249 family protein [Bacteroidota bacterium]